MKCQVGTAVDVGASPDAAQRDEARQGQLAAELVHDRQNSSARRGPRPPAP
ncbi:MAG: hypothetical protein JO090_09485 [Rhizobacter sp.]|nr:hypothetical protein [Rhizobacter sp.]